MDGGATGCGQSLVAVVGGWRVVVVMALDLLCGWVWDDPTIRFSGREFVGLQAVRDEPADVRLETDAACRPPDGCADAARFGTFEW